MPVAAASPPASAFLATVLAKSPIIPSALFISKLPRKTRRKRFITMADMSTVALR